MTSRRRPLSFDVSPPRVVAPGRGGFAAQIGQRSLTFYLFQSLLLVPIRAPWVFGLGVHLSTADAVGVALAVWLLWFPIASALDVRGLRGPAEVLLRRMTYGKHDPALPQSAGG